MTEKQEIKWQMLNFGPQHPSAHGVLRLLLYTSGEMVKAVIPQIGLLHRGTEKLLETKSYLKGLPYFDRLDYVSMISNEHSYTLIIESFINNIVVPRRTQFMRVIVTEITRILNHLMALTTHAMDLGALTPFLWSFEEREKLMEFYERISGARMHASYIRPGGLTAEFPLGLCDDIYRFLRKFPSRINEIEELLSKNRIFRHRLNRIAVLEAKSGLGWGLTGVMLRSTGLKADLRKQRPYETYNKLTFDTAIGVKGDSLDRYFIRIQELRQTVRILIQALNKLPAGKQKTSEAKLIGQTKEAIKKTMQNLILHFRIHSVGFELKPNSNYVGTEAPKGEFGVYLTTNKSTKPLRCKIKAPGYMSLQSITLLTKKHYLADVVTVIGTQDLVFGEIDR